MTALMQEVMERVQTLPEKKLEALLVMLSEAVDYDGNTIFVETNLTAEEKTITAEGDRNFKKHPEEYISLENYAKKRGISINKGKNSKLKVVYR